MRQLHAVIGMLCVTSALMTAPAFAQESATKPANQETAAPPPNPGRELVLAKCGQCHTDSMWRDQRQDTRAWEATLYRMVGRGALWSGEDIKTMASFLGTDFGPNIPRAKPAAR
jgi:mono/diheme cytochrome c family protein